MSGVDAAPDPATPADDAGVVRSFASVSRQRQAEAAAASAAEPPVRAGPAEEAARAPEETGERDELRRHDSWHAYEEEPEETEEELELRLLDEEILGVEKCNVLKLQEVMNNSTQAINETAMALHSANARYKKHFDEVTRSYADLMAQHGTAMERSRPYFEATQALTAASQRVQDVVNEFSAAASQHQQAKKELKDLDERLEGWSSQQVSLTREQQERFSRATEEVIKCQEERDTRETEYARALQDYNEAQRTAENWQQHIGHATVRKVQPAWRYMQQEDADLLAERAAITVLESKKSQFKREYKTALSGQEDLSNRVRLAREAHLQAKHSAAAGAQAIVAEESPEATHPAGEVDEVDGKAVAQRDAVEDPFTEAESRTTPRRSSGLPATPPVEERDCPFA